MIKTTNENIAYHWSKGESAQNSRGCYTTDGTKNEQGDTVLFNYTSGGMGYYSQTTSCHVGKARQYANWIQVNDVELKRNLYS